MPSLGLAATVVWLPMLRADSPEGALSASALVADPRARHFYDPARLAGITVGETLGARGKPVWDAYLFYGPGQRWEEAAPAPLHWFHQLTGSSWAGSDRYRTGRALAGALRETTGVLLHAHER